MYRAIPAEIQPSEDGIVVPEAAPAAATEGQPLLMKQTPSPTSEHREESSATTTTETSSKDFSTTTSTTINDTVLWCLWRAILAVLWSCCWIFGGYIVLFYIRAAWQGRAHAVWNEGLAGIYHAELPSANHAMLAHFIGGAYIVIMAPLQFAPSLRRKESSLTLHRWNGRILLVGCVLATIGGIYYVTTASSTAVPLVGQVANVTNVIFGLGVLLCAGQIYYHAAITKCIDLHKRWAYRLAGLICGSIAFRLYAIAAVLILGQGNPHLKAAFLLVYYTYMVPFVVLADYLWRRERQQEQHAWSSHASIYTVLGVALGLLIFIATLVLQSVVIWIPLMMVDTQSLEEEEEYATPFYGNDD